MAVRGFQIKTLRKEKTQTMKKTLKLVPAFAMLLVSAILVSTSTYAWFSMNSSVTATGMSVEAVTDGSLYISKAASKPDYDDIILGTVDFTDTAQKIRPTSTINLSDWYFAPAEEASNYAKSSTTNFSAIGTASNYYYTKTVWIRSENDFDSLVVDGVTITPTYNAGATDQVLDGALTVGFKVVDVTNTSGNVASLTATSAPAFVSNEAASARHGAVKAGTPPTIDTTNITFNPATGISSNASVALWTKGNTETTDISNYVFQVQIFVYFDGQSNSCYSNALLNAIDLTCDVNVSFAAE